VILRCKHLLLAATYASPLLPVPVLALILFMPRNSATWDELIGKALMLFSLAGLALGLVGLFGMKTNGFFLTLTCVALGFAVNGYFAREGFIMVVLGKLSF
jgi:hypothetical protein